MSEAGFTPVEGEAPEPLSPDVDLDAGPSDVKVVEGDASGEATEAGASVAQDIDELARLASERDEYLDALRRLQADFENYRKRVAKEQAELGTRATGDLVAKLLPVLDTIDLALAHDASSALEQVRVSLDEVLVREGLERLDPLGEPFDPTLHDAVAHEDGEGPPEIVGVMRPGYRWNGRLVRPAMVTVKGS